MSATLYGNILTKLDRRAGRMLAYMGGGGRILFVRVDTTIEESRELAYTIRGMMAGDFRLLIVNNVYGARDVTDLHWQNERICGLQIPVSADEANENNALWNYIFNSAGICRRF